METVSRVYCDKNHEMVNERFTRDKERIESLEDISRRLSELTVELQQITKRHDTDLADHGTRLRELEKRPGQVIDKAITALISAIVGGLASAVMALILL